MLFVFLVRINQSFTVMGVSLIFLKKWNHQKGSDLQISYKGRQRRNANCPFHFYSLFIFLFSACNFHFITYVITLYFLVSRPLYRIFPEWQKVNCKYLLRTASGISYSNGMHNRAPNSINLCHWAVVTLSFSVRLLKSVVTLVQHCISSLVMRMICHAALKVF